MGYLFIENYIEDKMNKLIIKSGSTNPEFILKTLKNVDFNYEILSENINGYYIYVSEKYQIIRVNSILTEFQREFVTFHEIGHCVLKHRGKILLDTKYTISKLKEEHEADLFAAYGFKLHNNLTKENINYANLPKKIKTLMNEFL